MKTIVLLSAGVLCTVLPLAAADVINRGVPGENSQEALVRLSRDAHSYHAQRIIILTGTNDAVNSQKLLEPEQYSQNLRQMIRVAKAAGYKQIILLSPGPAVESYLKQRHKYPHTESLNGRLQQFVEATRLAAEAENVDFIDLFALITKYAPLESRESLLRNLANSRSGDGLHFTASGAEKVAELAADKLLPGLQPTDRVVCFGDSNTYGANLKGAGSVSGEPYPAQLQRLLNQKESVSK